MLSMFFFFTLICCVISYINVNPMKSCFFLILSLLFGIPLISFYLHVWYSYFICLLFLSGIFVILVYFSSLSKISVVSSPLAVFFGIISLGIFYPSFYLYFDCVTMNNFYYSVFGWMFVWIILCLLFFMNFVSYFLNFSGALRKV